MADLTLTVPVNGKGPVDVLTQDPPPGAYEVEITGAEEHVKTGGTDAGKVSAMFSLNVTEPGPAQGISTAMYLGTDFTKAFNVGHFVNLFTGVMQKAGKTEADIKAALASTVTIPISKFVGKRAFIIVKAAPDELDAQGRPKLADKNFLTMPQYEAAKKVIAQLGAPAARKTNGAAAGAVQTGGPAPVTTGAAGAATPPVPGTNVVPGGGTPTPTPATGIGDLFG